MIRLAFVAIATMLAAALPATARERLAGPVPATLIRVVDGDTIAVRVRIWIGQEIEALVRIRGIDTPERRARCGAEKAAAEAATAVLEGIVAGHALTLTAIEGDKYFGRVVADVSADGIPVGAGLLAAGLARPYQGGRRDGWCG